MVVPSAVLQSSWIAYSLEVCATVLKTLRRLLIAPPPFAPGLGTIGSAVVNLCPDGWATPYDQTARVPLFPNVQGGDPIDATARAAYAVVPRHRMDKAAHYTIRNAHEVLGGRTAAGDVRGRTMHRRCDEYGGGSSSNTPFKIRVNAFLNRLTRQRVGLVAADGTDVERVRLLTSESRLHVVVDRPTLR